MPVVANRGAVDAAEPVPPFFRNLLMEGHAPA